MIDGIGAIFVGLLPKRVWDDWDLPVANMAFTSALLTIFAGAALGITGYFAYLESMLARVEFMPPPMMIYGYLSYLFATPRGLFSIYLALSGFIRTVSWWIDEPTGDPVLTAVDSLMVRSQSARRDRQARAAREKLEGMDEPDRLYDGMWAGVPDATYVVVAARRKPDWTKGTWIITDDGWFTLGEPFDRPMPHGIRTIYPLTLQTTTLDVLRKAVNYQLPPLRATKPT